MEKPFHSVLHERVYQLLLRKYRKSCQRKPAKHKTTSRDNISKGSANVTFKKSQMKAKEGRSGIQKKVTTHKNLYSSYH